MHNYCYAIWYFSILLSFGCNSFKSDQNGAEVNEPPTIVNSQSTNHPEKADEEKPNPLSSQEEQTPTDDLEDGFCMDDIYTTYLEKQFLFEKQPKKNNQKVSRDKKSPNTEGLFYARQRLIGPMSPYFGGIPVVSNPKVEFWLRYFKTQGRHTFIKWLTRAEAVRELVTTILKEQGLPPELFFLAMVESGFSNTAKSHVGALGTWQFMKGTAQLYGLKINHFVDERRDPVKSTLAASRFLTDLYSRFGDWYLAMAAYDAGPGRIRSAIRKTKTKNFWELAQSNYLRKETKQYVPKMLAALILASEPQRHGFNISVKDPFHVMPKNRVLLNKPIELSELAHLLNLPEHILRKWNPELTRGITPPIHKKEVYELRLAEDYIEHYQQIKDKIPYIEITQYLMHNVKPGDTLSAIARKYQVSIQQILKLNPALQPKLMRIGKEIAIPIPGIIKKKTSDQA